MHPIEAASRGSTRLLEYLSCDGSLSGGGGAFVPDWRRSIIPRVYGCVFAFPSPGCSRRSRCSSPITLSLYARVVEAARRDAASRGERWDPRSLDASCSTRVASKAPVAPLGA